MAKKKPESTTITVRIPVTMHRALAACVRRLRKQRKLEMTQSSLLRELIGKAVSK